MKKTVCSLGHLNLEKEKKRKKKPPPDLSRGWLWHLIALTSLVIISYQLTDPHQLIIYRLQALQQEHPFWH